MINYQNIYKYDNKIISWHYKGASKNIAIDY